MTTTKKHCFPCQKEIMNSSSKLKTEGDLMPFAKKRVFSEYVKEY